MGDLHWPSLELTALCARLQCDYALRPGFKMVDAVGKDASEETNVQVRCTTPGTRVSGCRLRL